MKNLVPTFTVAPSMTPTMPASETPAPTRYTGALRNLQGSINELPAAEWAVYMMKDGRRASEPFYWAETSICQSDDPGHSQALRVD